MSSPSLSSSAMRPVRRVSDKLMGLIMSGLLFVVAVVSLARLNDQVVEVPMPMAPVQLQRSLLFVDQGQGRILIEDADSGQSLRTLSAGEGSFIRGAVRSLVRTRQLAGTSLSAGFDLILYADGRLQLLDPLTDEALELSAFGPSNSGEFRALLLADLPSPQHSG